MGLDGTEKRYGRTLWAASLESALEQASQERKFVLVDFSKEDCPGCEALAARTLADPAVDQFLSEHFVGVELHLEDRQHRPHFTANRVIWTPTLAFFDRRGVSHYQTPGYWPAPLFLSLARIGLARCLMGWSRYSEAATHLERAVATENALTAEALYWLGMAYYLPVRRHEALLRAWGPLQERYPDSVWAARIPPDSGKNGKRDARS